MIYLDSCGTTRPYKHVVDTMSDVAYNYWGNPSANYSIADSARCRVEAAREKIANDINCKPANIIFTGSGCESNSLAISGFIGYSTDFCIYSPSIEHTSITEAVNFRNLSTMQCEIPVNKYGEITADMLDDCMAKNQKIMNRRALVTIAGANGEIGTIQDLKALASVVHKHNGVFHSDCTQLYAERKLDVTELGVDMMSISAQKIHGPRGASFLYVKDGIALKPIIYGSQEGKIRGGSYNTAAIVGMAKAIDLTREHNASESIARLRDRMLASLLSIPNTKLNGPATDQNRLSNHISLTIDGVDAETLVTLCDLHGVIIAKGSACQSHYKVPSKALKAIGLTDEQAFSTIRISLDEFNTQKEIDEAAKIISKLVERIRSDE